MPLYVGHLACRAPTADFALRRQVLRLQVETDRACCWLRHMDHSFRTWDIMPYAFTCAALSLKVRGIVTRRCSILSYAPRLTNLMSALHLQYMSTLSRERGY